MTPLAQALNSALLHFIWQGIAVGFLLWIALLLLRRRTANARYVVSCVALVLLAIAPFITAWTAYRPYSASQLSWKTIAGMEQRQGADFSIASPDRLSGLQSLEAWVLPLWGLGVALFTLRLMWCWGHTSGLRRSGTAADSSFLAMVSRAAQRVGVTRGIRVLMSSVAEVPSVIGWARPVLLLPVAVAAGLTPEQLEAVIAHELAHIRRHDYLVNLAQTVVETVLFYHPAVWWVSSRIRYERELCCDDLAVAAVGDAAAYARALARLEQVRVFQPSLAMGAADGPLFHRIERLLGGDGLQQGPSRLACAIGLLVGVACFAISMGWAEGRQEVRGNFGTVVEDFFPPIPAIPGIPTMPTIPTIPTMPTVPLKQMLAMRSVPGYVFAERAPKLLAEIEAFTQRSDVTWVLFRGDGVTSSGSSANETEARAARQSAGGGDVLWFRVEGKSYVTQDKAILDRVAEAGAPARAIADAQIAIQEQMQATVAMRQKNDRLQAGLQSELQANLEALKAQMPNVTASRDQLDSVRAELEKMRRNLDEMTNRLREQERAAFLENMRAQREMELQLRQAEAARQIAPQIPDLLRDAVNSGKARPVQ